MELCWLHHRFGHPLADKLYKVLERSGHDDVDKQVIDYLTKYCSHCQKHGKSLRRFKFILWKDQDSNFNYFIFVNIIYINRNPILHVIDKATRFQAVKWLHNISTKHTWDTLWLCWINTYIRPPNYITYNAKKNFTNKEFQQHTIAIAILTKSVLMEAHWFIGIVKKACLTLY